MVKQIRFAPPATWPVGIRAEPLVTDDRVIVATRDGVVYWLNRTDGSEVFNRNVEVEILTDLLLIEPSPGSSLQEPIVVVTTVDPGRLLFAFTLGSGQRLWTYPS